MTVSHTAAQELTIVTILRGRAPATVMVSGELDRASTACVGVHLAGLPAAGVLEVHLDLFGVRYRDRNVAYELAEQQARLARPGGRLTITSVAPALRMVAGADGTVPRQEQRRAFPVYDQVGSGIHHHPPETANQP